ncbi:MAG: hypothetical protein V3U59_04620 [Gammaproteobacteria bacterium]
MNSLLVWSAIALTALLGVIAFIRGLAMIARGRVMGAGIRAVFGVALIGLATFTALVALNLATYYNLTSEQTVVELTFEQTGPQRFKTWVRFPDGTFKEFALAGDEWQFDARVLKWDDRLTAIGFESLYRPDRLSGRFTEVIDETQQPHTVYKIAEHSGVDLWKLAQDYGHWIDFVDASYGSATYLPMTDGGRYTVTMGATGLISRPENEPAEEAVARWDSD